MVPAELRATATMGGRRARPRAGGDDRSVTIQIALDNTFTIRVCQPGPVAFQRANVSGGRRNDIDIRALPDFGRPRGFSISAAAAAPKISGKTFCALRARAKVSFVHAGLSRLVFSGLRFRFIPFHLAFGRVETDVHLFSVYTYIL
jgi:hypothetical protein